MVYCTTYQSPVGTLTMASEGEQLAGLWMAGQKYFAATAGGEMTERPELPVFKQAADWLDRYFGGEKPKPSELQLAPHGGEFRRAVWDMLCRIPYGELVTYGDIAKQMAAQMMRPSMSSQAVGGAVGHNPISIIIPCHRVVGAKGSLTGYAGGVATKIKLLELEGVDTARLRMPTKGTAL